MSVDHFGINVSLAQIDPVVSFLVASLEHLGFKEHIRPFPGVVGLGDERPYFWVAASREGDDGLDAKTLQTIHKRTHIAFKATNKEQVHQFYDAAMKAGAIDNGAPGPRPQYASTYYGAFVRDPIVGINWEVVTHN